jgi:hypothetical protein
MTPPKTTPTRVRRHRSTPATTSAGTSSDRSIAKTRWTPSAGISAINSPVTAKRTARKTHRPPRIVPTTTRNPPIHLAAGPTRNAPATASRSRLATASAVAQIESVSRAMCRRKISLNAAPNT